MVHLYSITDISTAGNKSRFILSERSNFHMIDILSIAFQALALCRLISLSVDEMLQSRYVN